MKLFRPSNYCLISNRFKQIRYWKGISPDDWEKIESKEHDEIYEDSFPFDFKSYKIDPGHVIWWQDYCYLQGRKKDKGHRTKQVFKLIELDKLNKKKILDIGCGNGQYSVFFAILGAEVYGCDISQKGILTAKKIAEANKVQDRCNFSVQNAACMNYSDNFFEIVLFHETLHHVIKYPNVREEVLRVTKNGGRVICAEDLSENPLIRIGAKILQLGKKDKGDVPLRISDLEEFSKGFSSMKIEYMSLLFMTKRLLEGYINVPFVRKLLLFVKQFDDFLLKKIPSMRKYCGEFIMILVK